MLRLSESELTAATMRQPWRPEPPDERARVADVLKELRTLTAVRSKDWSMIGRVAGLAIVGVGLIALALFALNTGGVTVVEPTPTVAALTATRPTTTDPPTTVPPPATTAPQVVALPPTTTLYVAPIGEPTPIDALRLTIYGIGDLRIGDPQDEVAGRLTATFGQPDSDSPVEPGTAHPGACPGSASRVLRWGILEITVSKGVFSGYRLDSSLGSADSPTADLRTASGLRVGATVSTLKTIYQSYSVVIAERPGYGASFSLQRSNGEELLWGPLTSADLSGVILGIYSPAGCGQA